MVRSATLRSFSVLLLVFFSSSGSSTEVPFLSGRINDNAGMLSFEVIRELGALLKAHEDSTSNQIVVLTVASLEGEVLEEYSYKVATTWKLGQKGKDNGVLLLVARDDRQVRIEVGSGLEGDLTDLTSGAIVRNEMLPRFKDGDFDTGVRSGVRAIIDAINGSYTPDAPGTEQGDFWSRAAAFSIFIVVVGLFTAIAILTKGGLSWFLFFFLIPFWVVFPLSILGRTMGVGLFLMYILGFLGSKFWFAKSSKGRTLMEKWGSRVGSASTTGRGWFSGGGASGRW